MTEELEKVGEINIKDMIYEVRGKQVMLDSDLAKLYHVETKRINEAVRNNLDKFPERFSFKLNDLETKEFLVENFDQKLEKRGGRYKNPRVFTEQGVAMLATILKSKIATQVSIQIMDAFVLMRKYISTNLIEQRYINELVLKDNKRINLLEKSFHKFEENKKINEIYFNGQIYDAYSKLIDIDKYNKQYNNLKILYNNTFHDRYLIIDNIKIYHCGASLNYAGNKTFSINVLEDKIVKEILLEKIKEIIFGRGDNE